MKKIYFALLSFIPLIATAQSVGISNTAITPDASSILELKSTKQGLLIPRMLSTERIAIPSPATGLMVYQTDTPPGFYYFDGAAWKQVGASESASSVNFRYYSNAAQAAYASANTTVNFGVQSFLNNATFSNNTFTATSSGIYKFDINLSIYGLYAGTMSANLAVNGAFYSGINYIITAGAFQNTFFSDYINLTAGDIVYVYVNPNVYTSISLGSSFSGFKIN